MPRLTFVALALGLSAGAAFADGPTLYAPGGSAPYGAESATLPPFVAQWDTNGNGRVAFWEIRRLPRHVFVQFDVNKNGVLDPTESARFDAARRGDVRLVGGRGGQLVRDINGVLTFVRADIDGSGALDRDEFRLAATDWLGLLDRDGNGAVTPEDFGRAYSY